MAAATTAPATWERENERDGNPEQARDRGPIGASEAVLVELRRPAGGASVLETLPPRTDLQRRRARRRRPARGLGEPPVAFRLF